MLQKKGQMQKKADDYFYNHGFNCAEATFLAAKEVMKLKEDLPSAAATGFGAGIGRHGLICGALAGAVMAAGLYAGRNSPAQKELYSQLQAAVFEILQRFERQHGSVNCRDLVSYDLQDPVQFKQFLKDKNRREKCRAFVSSAAGALADELEKIRPADK